MAMGVQVTRMSVFWADPFFLLLVFVHNVKVVVNTSLVTESRFVLL